MRQLEENPTGISIWFISITLAMFEVIIFLVAAPAGLLHDLPDAGYVHPELSPDPVPHELVIERNLE